MNWSNEWPTDSGHYWFYGWCFKNRDYSEKFYYVEVRKIQNGVMYITSGRFLHKAEGGEGIWQSVIFPELPEGITK